MRIVVALTLVAIGLSGCSSGDSVGNDAASPTASGTETSSPGTVHAMDISGFAFADADLTVQVGDSVTWTNQDSAPHTVTADGDDFDSGSLSQGDSFTHEFLAPGNYPYFCSIHPGMQGRIVVVDG